MSTMDPFDFAATWMAYRQGQLTEEAAKAFEQQLQADPKLEALHASLSHEKTTQESLLTLTQFDVEKAYRRCIKPALPLRRYGLWAAAAVLLVIAGATAFLTRPVPERQVFTSVDSSRWENAPRITLADGSTILLDTLTQVETTANLRLNNQTGLLTVDAVGAHEKQAGQRIKPAKWHRLDIPFGQRYSLRLPDGTMVTLNAGASLEFPSGFTGQNREVKLLGEAYFEVAPDKQHPFVVNIPGLKVTALGTAFNVQAYDTEDLFKTTLVNGRVAIEDTSGRVSFLKPGEQATYARNSGQLNVRPVDINLYTAWKENYFLFRETPLETIMQSVGHWYGMDVLYLNARNKHTKYTGKISMYPDIDAVLRKFEVAGDLSFETENRCIRIQRK